MLVSLSLPYFVNILKRAITRMADNLTPLLRTTIIYFEQKQKVPSTNQSLILVNCFTKYLRKIQKILLSYYTVFTYIKNKNSTEKANLQSAAVKTMINLVADLGMISYTMIIVCFSSKVSSYFQSVILIYSAIFCFYYIESVIAN